MRRGLRIGLAVALMASAIVSSALAEESEEAPGRAPETAGRRLFVQGCSDCHGFDGRGVDGKGPSLIGVGEEAADFYLRTGRMPLSRPGEEPERSESPYTAAQIQALVDYVGTLGGPPIPTVHPENGNLAEGQKLFTEHCAGCHQVAGEGGYVTDARVPRLKDATPTQVAEAVRIGPYLMPKFSEKAISDRQLDSIIAYIQASKKPEDRGGWGIGHIGPVPEGMVAWFIAAFVLVGLCALIGERIKS